MKLLFNTLLLLLSLNLAAYSANENHKTNAFISIPSEKNASQKQTIHLIKTYFEALNDRDMALFFSLMNTDVIHDINQGASEQGIEQFKSFMKKAINSSHEKLDHIVILVSDDGKYASAQWIDHGVYEHDYPGYALHAKNQQYALTGAHFFEIRNNKISRVTTYYNASDFTKQITHK